MSVQKLLKLQREGESLAEVARLKAGVASGDTASTSASDSSDGEIGSEDRDSQQDDGSTDTYLCNSCRATVESDCFTIPSIDIVSDVSLASSMLCLGHGSGHDPHGSFTASFTKEIEHSAPSVWLESTDAEWSEAIGQADSAAGLFISRIHDGDRKDLMTSLAVHVPMEQSRPMIAALWHRQAVDMSIALSDMIRESSMCSSLALVLENRMKQAEYEVSATITICQNKSTEDFTHLPLDRPIRLCRHVLATFT